MKLFKKIVDERQELELMKVERIGFWVLFWGLFAALNIQFFLNGFTLRQIAGEFIVLMLGVVVVHVCQLRKGLWSYTTNPSIKSNTLYSLGAAMFSGLIFAFLRYNRLAGTGSFGLGGFLVSFMMQFAIVFLACFVLLSIFGAMTNKRRAKLETELDENNAE